MNIFADGTQNRMIVDWMLKHGSITRNEAWTEIGVSELPKRISEIKRAGIEVVQRFVSVKNRHGKTVKVM